MGWIKGIADEMPERDKRLGGMLMKDEAIVKIIHRYQMKVKSLSVLNNLMAFALVVVVPFVVLFIILNVISGTCKPVHGLIMAAIVVLVILLRFVTVRLGRLQKKLKQLVGEYVTRGIVAERIDIQKYEPNGCFSRDFMRSSGVLQGYDKSYGSDYIKGIYRGNEIEYCDIKLEVEYDTTDSDGDRSHETVTVFCGPVISLALGRSLGDKRLRILERRSRRRKKGFLSDLFEAAADTIGNALGIEARESGVMTENEAFNNQFDVKTNDEAFAFYILTPQFMESIVSADKMGAGRTNICFAGDRVNIAIHNGADAFEIGSKLYSKKRLEESRQRMRSELNGVLCIVDEILKKERLFH